MSEKSADRNLLIGVLAVQMEFISRDQLVAAMSAWLLDKSQSFDAVLRSASAIDDDTQGLLVGLVDKHISMHLDDPSASLTSVSQTLPISDVLTLLPDDEVSKTLTMLPHQRPKPDPLMTAAPVPSRTSEPNAMRFRPLRAHSEGGLGTVSVACDEELGREVALKEIKESYADHPESRRRFLIEGEITGCLEHPGIVPVYGMGEYADGRPFYAMRFIRGQSLQHAIAGFHADDDLQNNSRSRELELRKLLRRLIDVCDAVEYAHSRGVLHRDLKPDNVMLGKYGETLVVDWGLAKADDQIDVTNQNEPPLRLLSGGGTSSTQMGECLGTPAYMSPEQASGRLDLMRATSDVYSLGATLHAILTGKAPFPTSDLKTVLNRVRTGEFEKPRDRDPRISPSMESVCLKAMSLEPKDRYQSAAEFASDIERWLSDEPVIAYVEPIPKRIARWSRRHRSLVSSFVAGSLASILILTVSLVFLVSANQRERAARELADSERSRAENNLSVAQQAVSTMLSEVGREELAQVPQMEQTRAKLLTKARTFYEGFLRQRPTDEALRLEWAMAQRNLAEIDRLVDRHEQAEDRYRQAIRELKDLAELRPSETIYRRTWASVSDELGQLVKLRDSSRAEEFFDEAIRLQEGVSSSDTDPELSQEIARSFYNRGMVRAEQGKLSAAGDDVIAAIETLKSIIDYTDNPDLSVTQELARCYNNLANITKRVGNAVKARDEFEIAINLLEVQVERFPDNRDLSNELAIYQNNFANLLRTEGELSQADQVSSQAIDRLEVLAQPLPALANELANALHNRGVILSQRNMRNEAVAQYREASEILLRLTKEFPMVPLYRDRLGNALFQLGTMRFQAGKTNEAVSLVRDAMSEHKSVLEQNPKDPSFRQHLKNDYVGLALIQLAQKQRTDAMKTAFQFASDFPEDGDAQFDAAQLVARCIPLVESSVDGKAKDEGSNTNQASTTAEEEDENSVAGKIDGEEVEMKVIALAHVPKIVEMLQSAKQLGFNNNEKVEASLKESGAFHRLRDDASIVKILKQLNTE